MATFSMNVEAQKTSNGKKVLVAYFSRSGNIKLKNNEIFILMIQSILHLILIIVIVILSIIKPLTSGLCLMVILVCLYLE